MLLAGGQGSRLGVLTEHLAKPAVPFGGKYRIIDFSLSNCVNSGIRQIMILTQYKAHSLIQHIQRGWGYLRGEFGELRGEFGELRGEFGELRGEIGELRGEFGELRGDIGEQLGGIRAEIGTQNRLFYVAVVTMVIGIAGLLFTAFQLGAR